MKFAECMRAHGVSDFPDPDAKSELTIDGVNGSWTRAAVWKQATTACKDLQPPGSRWLEADAQAAVGEPSSSPSASATTA